MAAWAILQCSKTYRSIGLSNEKAAGVTGGPETV
jgi:hypothetical protein